MGAARLEPSRPVRLATPVRTAAFALTATGARHRRPDMQATRT